MRLRPVAKPSASGNLTSKGGEIGGSFIANATLYSQHLPGNPRVSASLYRLFNSLCRTGWAGNSGSEYCPGWTSASREIDLPISVNLMISAGRAFPSVSFLASFAPDFSLFIRQHRQNQRIHRRCVIAELDV